MSFPLFVWLFMEVARDNCGLSTWLWDLCVLVFPEVGGSMGR